MSTKLDEYTALSKKREELVAKHAKIFAELDSLDTELSGVESALKADARVTGDQSNGVFDVKVVTPYTKKFDWKVISTKVNKDTIYLALSEGLIEVVPESVVVKDYDKFTRFGRDNGFADVLQQAYSETAGTPRVSIVKVKGVINE